MASGKWKIQGKRLLPNIIIGFAPKLASPHFQLSNKKELLQCARVLL